MIRIFVTLLAVYFLQACTSSNTPLYNLNEFDTVNYQKNVADAIDPVDLLSDFEQNNIASKTIDPSDISNLVQADLYYNQGNYTSAFPFYNLLALKYKDPRIIYKAIFCLEYANISPAKTTSLNNLINLFIKTDPESKLSKLFRIKVALDTRNIEAAENNLDALMTDKSNAGKERLILLFISKVVSNNINSENYAMLNSFADYILKNYAKYPEAHLVAILAYSVSNNEASLANQVTYINQEYPNWSIPLYWSLGILIQHNHIDTMINILDPILKESVPDPVLQKVYIAALLNSTQVNKAKVYFQSLINSPNRNNMLIDLGILAAKNKEYDEALNYFNQVQVTDNRLNQILSLIKASIYDYQGQTEDAIKQYELIKAGPLTSISQIMLLNAFINTNNYVATDNILNKLAKEGNMQEKQAIIFKSGFYLGEGKYQKGYDLIKSKLNKYGRDSDYLYQYAALSGMLGKSKQAISLYKKYIKQNPGQAYGYNDLAYIYADQTTNYIQARKYAEMAYKIAPNDPDVLDTLSWVYYKLGDYNKALSYVKTSYTLNYDPESAKHLMAIYTALYREDLAKEVIIINKIQLQKELALQLLQKSVILLGYSQFNIEIK